MAVTTEVPQRKNRTSPGGYIRFDRNFRRLGVGRLQMSSGTDNPDVFERRNGIISRLAEDGQIETLRALKSGEISIQELDAAYRKGKLDTALADARAARASVEKPSSVSLAPVPLVKGTVVEQQTSPQALPAELQVAMRLGLLLIERLTRTSAAGAATSDAHALVRLLGLHGADLPAAIERGPGAVELFQHGVMATPRVVSARQVPAVGPHVISIPGVDRPFAEEAEPLWSTLIDRVVPALECGPQTRRRYATSLEALRRKMRQYKRDEDLRELDPPGNDVSHPFRYDELAVEVFHTIAADGKVGDLRRANRWFWRSLWRQWDKSPADWNHMRRGLAAALTGLFGHDSRHLFRQAIINAIPVDDEGEGRTPDLTVERFWEIVDHLPPHVQPVPVVLVATGMRMSEYLSTGPEHLKPSIFAIDVPGTKTSVRGGIGSKGVMMVDPSLWSWIEAGIPAPHRHKRIWEHWKDACAKAGVADVHLHDLRHCLGQWTTDAGVPEKSVQWALRHRDPNMTRRYTRTRAKRDVATAIGTVLHRP